VAVEQVVFWRWRLLVFSLWKCVEREQRVVVLEWEQGVVVLEWERVEVLESVEVVFQGILPEAR